MASIEEKKCHWWEKYLSEISCREIDEVVLSTPLPISVLVTNKTDVPLVGNIGIVPSSLSVILYGAGAGGESSRLDPSGLFYVPGSGGGGGEVIIVRDLPNMEAGTRYSYSYRLGVGGKVGESGGDTILYRNGLEIFRARGGTIPTGGSGGGGVKGGDGGKNSLTSSGGGGAGGSSATYYPIERTEVLSEYYGIGGKGAFGGGDGGNGASNFLTREKVMAMPGNHPGGGGGSGGLWNSPSPMVMGARGGGGGINIMIGQ